MIGIDSVRVFTFHLELENLTSQVGDTDLLV